MAKRERRTDENGNETVWGDPKPIVPKAQKPTSVTPPELIPPENHNKRARTVGKSGQLSTSIEKVSGFRTEDSGFELTEAGRASYEMLVSTAPKIDLTRLGEIEERIPGDRQKIISVLESLALGARHREALADQNWVWSNFSIYRTKFPVVNELYKIVSKLGEDTRQILRLDEAHRRAVDGVEEPIYSPSGKFCGMKIKYSDALLTMFLKADHPDKFGDKVEVKNSGVVLNMQMGLRENVKQTAMTQGDIKIESPFQETAEELPGGV